MRPTIDTRPVPDPLDRQQQRREQSIPTVTVLRGPVGLGVHRWRTWAARQGRVVVAPSGLDPTEAVAAWVLSLAMTRDLVSDAKVWLARACGETLDDLGRRRTANDFEWFWRTLALPSDRAGTVAACRCLLSEDGGVLAPAESAERLLRSLREKANLSGAQVLAAIAAAVPPSALPSILLTPPGANTDANWLIGAAELLTELVALTPAVPAAVAAEATLVEAVLRTGPRSHARALLREGVVAVESLAEPELAERLRAAGATVGLSIARRLATDGATAELVTTFAEAARRLGPKAAPEEEDAARSAAERFLFERLETLPATAGAFLLNQSLDFHHGPALAQADLYAASLRLVIELDGSYFHLREPAAYRRDRKKDWEYQRRGYLVLRFLSEDVVERLEEILDTILAAVEYRRSPSQERGRRA